MRLRNNIIRHTFGANLKTEEIKRENKDKFLVDILNTYKSGFCIIEDSKYDDVKEIPYFKNKKELYERYPQLSMESPIIFGERPQIIDIIKERDKYSLGELFTQHGRFIKDRNTGKIYFDNLD